MNAEPDAPADPRVAPARLFGALLLRELDGPTLASLRAPEVAAALAELGVELPEPEALDALAAEFFATLLQPAGAPPLVQSVWTEGKYDGEAAVAARRAAAAAGLELAAGARNAPFDHLGCLLTLWAELCERDASAAADFARRHLAWVARSSAPTAPPDRFYGQVLRAAAALCADLATS